MKYSCKDGYFKKGDILNIKIDRKANVRLMDGSNFMKFKNGQAYTYFGGEAATSPFNIIVPRTDHWYIVIDLGGETGILSYSIKVFK